MTVNSPWPHPSGSVIVLNTIPVYLLCHAKTNTIKPRCNVQSAADGDTDDLLEVIVGGALSKTITGWALYNEANKLTLSDNNATFSKDTAFTTGDGIWIGMRIPVSEAILTTGQGTIVPGTRLCGAGLGYVRTHPDDVDDLTAVTTAATTYYLNTSTPLSGKVPVDPTICICLSHVTTADALQVIEVAPLW